MKLSELLCFSQLKSLSVMAGLEGLSRNVTGAIMLDNPEMVNWMREGEILLTTGYIFKENPEEQIKILDELIKGNAGGLAIKVRRYFDEIPSEMIEIANQHDFPLLQIPYYLSLSEVSEIINRNIYLAENAGSAHRNLSQSLFEVIQSNGDIRTILNQGEAFYPGAFAFLDLQMRVKYDSIGFRQYTSRSHFIGEVLFPKSDVQKNNVKIDCSSLLFAEEESFLQKGQSFLLHPVKFEGELLGYLLLVPVYESDNYETAESICQKIALTISIAILRERTYISFKNRQVEKFLDSLVTEGELSYSEIVKSANYCNIPINATYICCVISFPSHQELIETNDWVGAKTLNRKKLVAAWEGLSGHSCRILVKHNNVILILSQDEHLTAHEQVALVMEYCMEIKNGLIDPVDITGVSFGIGEPTDSIAQVYRSYSQALRAADLVSKIKEDTVGCYRRYILYELIYDSPNAKLALIERLKPLMEYDEQHHTNLIQTLDTYFKNNQNSIPTARELFVHRNTLLYRLERISEVLGLDFSNSEQILIIQLALKALLMCN